MNFYGNLTKFILGRGESREGWVKETPVTDPYACITTKPINPWTHKIISGMFIVLRPIRFKMNNQRKRITISVFVNGKIEDLSWKKKPTLVSWVFRTFQLITLVVFCGYVSKPIGWGTLNIPEIISGFFGLMGFVVIILLLLIKFILLIHLPLIILIQLLLLIKFI